jgi:hypothetical protein
MHDRLLRHNTPPLGARTRYLAGRRSMTTPGPTFCSTAYIKTRTFRHVLLLYDVFSIRGGHTARLYTKHTALTVVTILTICFVFWMTITANSDYFGKEHGRLLMEIVSDYCGCEVHSFFCCFKLKCHGTGVNRRPVYAEARIWSLEFVMTMWH